MSNPSYKRLFVESKEYISKSNTWRPILLEIVVEMPYKGMHKIIKSYSVSKEVYQKERFKNAVKHSMDSKFNTKGIIK